MPKIDGPPLNGNWRAVASWLIGIMLTGLTLAGVLGAAKIIDHSTRIAVIESQYQSIDKKLDHLIELRTGNR